jgi:hypothetical protein
VKAVRSVMQHPKRLLLFYRIWEKQLRCTWRCSLGLVAIYQPTCRLLKRQLRFVSSAMEELISQHAFWPLRQRPSEHHNFHRWTVRGIPSISHGVSLRIGETEQGRQNKIIAYELNMCESTVKVHIRQIMRKLKARNRTQVVLLTSNMHR